MQVAADNSIFLEGKVPGLSSPQVLQGERCDHQLVQDVQSDPLQEEDEQGQARWTLVQVHD